jgi:hypothetical protein
LPRRWLFHPLAKGNMEDIYRLSVNSTQEYQCVIEGNENCVWMYLHHLADKSVIGDAPLCSLVDLMTLTMFNETYQRGETPPLVEEYSTDNAVLKDITNERISINRSKDNQSVVALIDNAPFSMILKNEKKGYSQATLKEGPWGNPWDNEKYQRNFG